MAHEKRFIVYTLIVISTTHSRVSKNMEAVYFNPPGLLTIDGKAVKISALNDQQRQVNKKTLINEIERHPMF